MFKSLTAIQLIVIASAFFMASSLEAGPNGHYRWTDANGTIQYADRPPEGVEAEFIKFSSSKPSKQAEKTSSTQAATPKMKAAAPSHLESVVPKDPKLCKQAQRNLKALEGARIRITEPDGSKRMLTEDEKKSQREDAKKFMAIHC